jgi:hypothetical protein
VHLLEGNLRPAETPAQRPLIAARRLEGDQADRPNPDLHQPSLNRSLTVRDPLDPTVTRDGNVDPLLGNIRSDHHLAHVADLRQNMHLVGTPDCNAGSGPFYRARVRP